MIDALAAAGLQVERLLELQVPETLETNQQHASITRDWGRKWPAEDVWVARK